MKVTLYVVNAEVPDDGFLGPDHYVALLRADTAEDAEKLLRHYGELPKSDFVPIKFDGAAIYRKLWEGITTFTQLELEYLDMMVNNRSLQSTHFKDISDVIAIFYTLSTRWPEETQK